MKGVIVFLVCFTVAAFAADPVSFFLQFTGTYNPTSGLAYLKALPQDIRTHISVDKGVSSDVSTRIGTKADFFYDYTVSNTGAVTLTGNITFGTHLNSPNKLFFNGVGQGDAIGSGIYNIITRGEGAFAGATGFFTQTTFFLDSSNLISNAAGIVLWSD